MDARLPFAAPGAERTGDGVASPHLAEVRRQMFLAKLLADAAQVPVMRLHRVLGDGSQLEARVSGPIERVYVRTSETPEVEREPEQEAGTARLVWLPEGFMITPRTTEAPDGYGMPPTPNGRGTPRGPLRQVIINRLQGNADPRAAFSSVFLDAWARGGGDIAVGQALMADTEVQPASLFYMDWELATPGYRIGMPMPTGAGPAMQIRFAAQFSARFVPVYAEIEGTAWHCHRPAPAAEEPVELRFRMETNAVRADAGMPPLGPPLRGMARELANAVTYQMAYSGIMAHGSRLYRDGYQEFADRLGERGGWIYAAGENLHLATLPYGEALAQQAVHDWRESPGHYANMVADWGEQGEAYAFMETASTEATITAQQPPPYELDTPTIAFRPPVHGSATAQILGGMQRWLYAHGTTHGVRRRRVGLYGRQDMFIPAYAGSADMSVDPVDPYVTFCGRLIFLTESGADARLFRVVAATTRLHHSGACMLRIAAITRDPGPPGPTRLSLIEGRIDDFVATQAELARYTLPPQDASLIARPVFSESGERMVFSILRVVDAPPGRLANDFSSEALPSGQCGHINRFVEFSAGRFANLGEDQLMIAPLEFGGGVDAHHYAQQCVGGCRLLAAYDDEQVVYARIEVEASAAQASPHGYTKAVRGTLIFPNSRTLVYTDTRMDTVSTLNAAAAYGVFRHLLPFDIMEPDGVAFVEYTLPEDDTKRVTARLVFDGKEIKFAPDPLNAGIDSRVGFAFPAGYLVRTDVASLGVHRGSTGAAGFHTHFGAAAVGKAPPTVPYPAALVSWGRETAPRKVPRGLGGEIGTVGYMEYVLMGPVIVADGAYDHEEQYQRVEEFWRGSYRGEHIVAGRIESTLGPVGTTGQWGPGGWIEKPAGAWQGEDQFFHASTLDLKAITGLPDLRDNILPIGVL